MICIKCNEEKDVVKFDKGRNMCRSCRSEQAKRFEATCPICNAKRMLSKSKFKGANALCKICTNKELGRMYREEKSLIIRKKCIKCGVEKDVSDFYKSQNTNKCKACWPQSKTIERRCPKCNVIELVSRKAFNMRKNASCRSCAAAEVSSRPSVLDIRSLAAKRLVESNGGKIGNQKGDTHYNWKGGITPEVLKIRASEEMRHWVKAVLKRDNYTCQECGIGRVKLCAHHLKSFSAYPELRTELSNGQTLCEPCHRKTHNYGSKARKKSTKA